MSRDLLQEIKDRLEGRIDHTVYKSFFEQMTVAAQQNNHYIIATNKDDITTSIVRDTHTRTLVSILTEIIGAPVEVSVVTSKEDLPDKILAANEFKEAQPTGYDAEGLLLGQYRINPDNTFDNFVVGKSNSYAQAVCLGTAESMAQDLDCKKSYNPIFIYGGSGMGKTHLMHAVAWHILMSQPTAKIIYVSCENFTNEMIEAIGSGRTAAFRNKYRQADVLLIDDIQFLTGREGTQQEFFHTFTGLHEANKQIIICSDRPPNEIQTLEDRLRTRFQGGIIADIQMPDLETRVAILRRKAQRTENLRTMAISDEILTYIAERMETSIRELEGFLISLGTYASINGLPVTLELAKDLLNERYNIENTRIINAESITDKICDHFGVSKSDIVGKSRKKQIVFPRQLAMYLCRQLTEMSLPKIGEYFGGRDHTTVIHAVEKIEKDIQKEPYVKSMVQTLTKDLRGE